MRLVVTGSRCGFRSFTCRISFRSRSVSTLSFRSVGMSMRPISMPARLTYRKSSACSFDSRERHASPFSISLGVVRAVPSINVRSSRSEEMVSNPLAVMGVCDRFNSLKCGKRSKYSSPASVLSASSSDNDVIRSEWGSVAKCSSVTPLPRFNTSSDGTRGELRQSSIM